MPPNTVMDYTHSPAPVNGVYPSRDCTHTSSVVCQGQIPCYYLVAEYRFTAFYALLFFALFFLYTTLLKVKAVTDHHSFHYLINDGIFPDQSYPIIVGSVGGKKIKATLKILTAETFSPMRFFSAQ